MTAPGGHPPDEQVRGDGSPAEPSAPEQPADGPAPVEQPRAAADEPRGERATGDSGAADEPRGERATDDSAAADQPREDQPPTEGVRRAEQTRDDTDVGWGEVPEPPDAHDQWLLDQRPPHWD